MAGQLTIDTLKASSGVLATQNGMTGIAKAWVNFAGATATITGSFNVGSITKNGTGDFTINFTTAMPDATYSLVGTCQGGSVAAFEIDGGTYTASACRVLTRIPSGSYVDVTPVCAVVLR